MRAIITLLWEQIRNSWHGIAGLAALLAVYYFLLASVPRFPFWALANNYELARGIAYMPTIGALAVLFINESRGALSFEFPRRMLTLPVSTPVLTFTPLIYRYAMIALIAAAGGYICDKHLQPYFLHEPQIVIALIAVAMIQSFIAMRAGYGQTTGTAIAAGLAVISLIALVPVFQISQAILTIGKEIQPTTVLPTYPTTARIIGYVVLLGWTAAAWRATAQARSEIPEDPVGRFTGFLQAITYFERSDAPFEDQRAAQRWYEWRRGAYLFPWTSLGLGLLLLIAFRMTGDTIETRFLVPFNLLAVAPLVIATLTGYSVTRVNREYEWFVCARPLDTRSLVRARFWAATWGIGIGYVLLFIAFLVTYKIASPDTPILPSLVDDLRKISSLTITDAQGVALLCALFVAILLLTWTTFWVARVAAILLFGAGIASAIWNLIFGPLYFITEYRYITPSGIFFYAFTLFAFIALILTFIMALRLGLMRYSVASILCVLWIGGCIAAFPIRGSFFPDEFIALMAWIAMPALPFVTVPLSLHLQRSS